jgi:nicotinamide riboside transporter PnuC
MSAWLITAASIAGTVLVIRKSPWGHVAWILSNAGWLVIALTRGDAPQAVLWSVYLALAVVGAVTWFRERRRGT